jgi:predicted transglutaminase-like cysteine proteinase
MKFNRAAGAVLCGLLCWTAPAGAMSKSIKEDAATVYGRATPPVGYVDFCARQPGECTTKGKGSTRLNLSPEKWNLLYQVNNFVNGKIAPMTDLDLYGEAEHWAIPTDAGDCEDYLLLKKKYLEGLGFPSENLLITVVLDEKSEGHAVLTVTSADGDYILDNRRNEILRWNDTNYRFLKRQSQQSPVEWVSLTNKAIRQAGGANGGSASNK